MKKYKVLKKSSLIFAIASLFSIFAVFNVNASKMNIEKISDDFDEQKMSALKVLDSWGDISSFVEESYLEDEEDGGYKLKLTSKTLDEQTAVKHMYAINGYQNGVFSVNLTPVSLGEYTLITETSVLNTSMPDMAPTVTTSTKALEAYVSIYFRVVNQQTHYYEMRLFDDRITLIQFANWTSKTLSAYNYNFVMNEEHEIKVDFKSLDDNNYIKVYLDGENIIDYQGAISSIETSSSFATKNWIGIGLCGTNEDYFSQSESNEGTTKTTITKTCEATKTSEVLFDDFTIYGDITENPYNASAEFSSEKQGPNWYYMTRNYTASGEINGNLVELESYDSDNGDYCVGWTGDYNIAVGQNYLRPTSNEAKHKTYLPVKVFKAPYNGTVTIAADGPICLTESWGAGPSHIQITKNDEVIWPLSTTTDWTLWETNNNFANVTLNSSTLGHTFSPINVEVSKNDEIGFVVAGDGQYWNVNTYKTTWKPTVKYLDIGVVEMTASLTDGENTYFTVSELKQAIQNGALETNIDVIVGCNLGYFNPYQLVAALYDAQSNLLDVKYAAGEGTVISLGEKSEKIISFGTLENIEDGSFIKVFILKGLDNDNRVPLTNEIKIDWE